MTITYTSFHWYKIWIFCSWMWQNRSSQPATSLFKDYFYLDRTVQPVRGWKAGEDLQQTVSAKSWFLWDGSSTTSLIPVTGVGISSTAKIGACLNSHGKFSTFSARKKMGRRSLSLVLSQTGTEQCNHISLFAVMSSAQWNIPKWRQFLHKKLKSKWLICINSYNSYTCRKTEPW